MAQQLAWRRAYSEIKSAGEWTAASPKLKRELEDQCSLLQKQVVVRVRAWLKKLTTEQVIKLIWPATTQSSPHNLTITPILATFRLPTWCGRRTGTRTPNCSWTSCGTGRSEDPFTSMPPGGPLPHPPEIPYVCRQPFKVTPQAGPTRQPVGGPGRLPGAAWAQGSSSHGRTAHESATQLLDALPGTTMRLPVAALTRNDAGQVADARGSPPS